MSGIHPDPQAGVGLTVSAVASRLGVAPATLRTWDRRYGVGPSLHTAGSHRKYSPDDVARLDRMRSLILEGFSPADAARVALQNTDVPETKAPTGGGRVIPLGSARADTRGLARAANSLDPRACLNIITSSLVKNGVLWTWDNVVSPVMVGIGQQWEATGEGIDAEHILSDSAITAFQRYVNTNLVDSPGLVLLASAEHDLHSLPLYAIAAAVCERGVRSTVLGPRVPVDALSHAMHTTRPAAVLVWCSMHEQGCERNFEHLPGLRPAPLVLAAGPGWPDSLPATVTRVTSLSESVTALCGAAGHVVWE